jgi:RimJ/RimL family protein N-acetyltransferase
LGSRLCERGHLRERWIVGGEKCDSLIYGLLADEWKAGRARAAMPI